MLEKEKEIWKDVQGYEGYYQASNLGRVRSLDRMIITKDGRECFYRGSIIKGTLFNGYRQTTLRKGSGSIGKTFKFSQLVAMAFLNHKPNGHELIIDHIDGNRKDDRLNNLRVVTFRENISTCFRSDKKTFSSKYVGVSWSKCASKWVAQIRHNEGVLHLGSFNDEIEASNAYQEALLKIKNGSFIETAKERASKL